MSYTGAYQGYSQPSAVPALKTYTYRTCSKAYPEMRSLALVACGMPDNDYHSTRRTASLPRHYQPSRPTYVEPRHYQPSGPTYVEPRHYQPSRPTYVEPTYTYQPYVTATPAYTPRSLGGAHSYVHTPYDDDLLSYQPPGSLGTTHSYLPYYARVGRPARRADDDDSDDVPRSGPSASGYKYIPKTYCPRDAYKPRDTRDTSVPSVPSSKVEDAVEKAPRHKELPISDQVAMLEKLRNLRRELGKDERELKNAKNILQSMQR